MQQDSNIVSVTESGNTLGTSPLKSLYSIVIRDNDWCCVIANKCVAGMHGEVSSALRLCTQYIEKPLTWFDSHVFGRYSI